MEKTAAELSGAELAMARAEARLLSLPYCAALRTVLLSLESVAALRLANIEASMVGLFRLEALLRQHGGANSNNAALGHLLELDGCSTRGAADCVAAFRFRQLLDWLNEQIKPQTGFSPQLILEIRQRCLNGPDATAASGQPSADRQPGFRDRDYPDCRPQDRRPCSEGDRGLYRPPAAGELDRHIQGLCDYTNRRLLSPIAQSAVLHFYFESIKPFPDHLERTGQALCHALHLKRGLYDGLLAPISLLPAIDTPRQQRYLKPYRHEPLRAGNDEFWALQHWMEYCARAMDVAVSGMDIYQRAIGAVIEHWQEQAGKVEKGSALECLLYALPGQPIITVTQAMQLTGKGFSAANDALARLEQTGVVRIGAPIGRNRSFVAHDALAAYDSINQKVLPRVP
jgi:Fic family protein